MPGTLRNALRQTLTLSAVFCFGCIQVVKTDMDTYLQNKNQFKRKHVIFSTTMEDITKRYDLYQGKDIELSAPVRFFGRDDFNTWYIEFEENNNTICAYESNYSNYVDIHAHNLLLWVTSEKGHLTVRGKLKKNGIELTQLAYKDYTVQTDLKPYYYKKTSTTRPSGSNIFRGYRYRGN